MKKATAADAAAAVRCFEIDGELVQVAPYERGHIHHTFISVWRQPYGVRRYLHQRMNDTVFRDVAGLMTNIERVTEHVRKKIAAEGSTWFRTLRLVPARGGGTSFAHSSGPWRTYRFIENTESFDQCRDEEQAHETALAFGRFQRWLADLDVGHLGETIPLFFSTPHRLRQFEEALARDAAGRASAARAEIEFARARAAMAGVIEEHLAAGRFPRRVVHGDTKLNNVLFDRDSGRAVAIVDLDTCMPAYSLYDFGDLVRFTAATSAEDETDLERAGMDLGLYRALVEGYLEGAGDFLTAQEVELMPFSARLVTFTIGLRFLADFLAGDVYFNTTRPGQNLDRARVQFRMVREMEEREPEMAALSARRRS